MKKIIILVLSILFVVCLGGCKQEDSTEQMKYELENYIAKAASKPNKKTNTIFGTKLYEYADVFGDLIYDGLDLTGLEQMNVRYGSDGFGDAQIGGGCSITFAKYIDGTVGAVRNMDLQLSKFCSYELFINPGENVTYPTWAIAYTGIDEKSSYEVARDGISIDRFNQLPFTATDTMSFGYDAYGDRASLYCAVLMRSDELDENGNYKWVCKGTCPGAPIRCSTHSAPTLIAANCVTIDQALAYVGAVDETYRRIFPSIDPTLDVYTFNIETENMSNHWFEVIAMEDATGRHGVLEFIDDKAIWHEGIDYSFNFFLQEDYLYNEDGSFKEQHGAGIGRYKATVPYLDEIGTIAEHVALMEGVSYSHMTFYNEEDDYVGYDYHGKPVDWRSEYTGTNVFRAYNKYHNILHLDTSEADKKYPLYAHYLDTDTNQIVLISSYDEYAANEDHLQVIYDMNYVLAEENREEVMNFIRWSGCFYSGLSASEIKSTNSAWQTYFRVIADPEHHCVTRWFNENVNTADTYTWDDAFSLPEE